MDRQSRKQQRRPQNLTSPTDDDQVPETAQSNIEPLALRVRMVNVLTVWSNQALHAIITSSQHRSTENVDSQMHPSRCILSLRTTALEQRCHNSKTLIGMGKGDRARDDGEGHI
ncbi:hypothetical protein AWENTII_011578 [Aspergillus wentii]